MEARINAEEADKRERASEIRREERLKKIKFMADMDDSIEVSAADSPPKTSTEKSAYCPAEAVDYGMWKMNGNC